MGKLFDWLMVNGDYEAMQRIALYKAIQRKLDSGEPLTEQETNIYNEGPN